MFKLSKLKIFFFFGMLCVVVGMVVFYIHNQERKSDDLASVYAYISAIKQITRENESFYAIINAKFQASVLAKDKARAKDIVTEIDIFSNNRISVLKKKKPPRALKKYHFYILKTYEYRRRANLLYFAPVKEEYLFCNDMAALNYKHSLEELNRIYTIFNAPQEKKDAIANKIKELKTK